MWAVMFQMSVGYCMIRYLGSYEIIMSNKGLLLKSYIWTVWYSSACVLVLYNMPPYPHNRPFVKGIRDSSVDPSNKSQ